MFHVERLLEVPRGTFLLQSVTILNYGIESKPGGHS